MLYRSGVDVLSCPSSASAPPPTLNTVHSSVFFLSASNDLKVIPLGWNGKNTWGFQTISTGACGCSTSRMATSVMCPFPVAARLPYKVTSNDAASGCLAKKISAAFRGPMVWLLEGPVPIRYNSLIDFICALFMFCKNMKYMPVVSFFRCFCAGRIFSLR